MSDISFRPSYARDAFAAGLRVPAAALAAVKEREAELDTGALFPTGPLVYERDWLLKFRDTCTTKPAALNAPTSIVATPAEQETLRQAVFAAQAEREAAYQAQRSAVKIKPGQKRAKGGAAAAEAETADLVKGENRWLPSAQDGSKAGKTLEQSFLSNLNKLTLENFALLSAQLVAMLRQVTSLAQLRQLVARVFEKALAEQKFAAMYAQLCAILAPHAPWFENRESKQRVSFKSELLNLIQDEFEDEHIDDLDEFLVKQAGGKLVGDELEEARIKYRARKLGNVKFLGELYQVGPLPGKILRQYVLAPLLRESRDKAASGTRRGAAIEKLGKLLTTIGETLESRDPDVADRHFAVLERVSKADDKTLSSRVRFLLLDLLELRDNDWVPRRKSERPQRIGDVHADAAAADADYAYRLPDEQISGMERAAAALPPPRGAPTRSEATDDAGYDICVPQAEDGSGKGSSSTSSTSGKKSGGKKVSFGGEQKSPEDQVASMIEELFSSHDTDEAVIAFSEVEDNDTYDLVLRVALEAVSPNTELLAELTGKLLSDKQLDQATIDDTLERLLNDLPDIAVDVPKAPQFVGSLLKGLAAAKLCDANKLIAKSELDGKVADKVRAEL